MDQDSGNEWIVLLSPAPSPAAAGAGLQPPLPGPDVVPEVTQTPVAALAGTAVGLLGCLGCLSLCWHLWPWLFHGHESQPVQEPAQAASSDGGPADDPAAETELPHNLAEGRLEVSSWSSKLPLCLQELLQELSEQLKAQRSRLLPPANSEGPAAGWAKLRDLTASAGPLMTTDLPSTVGKIFQPVAATDNSPLPLMALGGALALSARGGCRKLARLCPRPTLWRPSSGLSRLGQRHPPLPGPPAIWTLSWRWPTKWRHTPQTHLAGRSQWERAIVVPPKARLDHLCGELCESHKDRNYSKTKDLLSTLNAFSQHLAEPLRPLVEVKETVASTATQIGQETLTDFHQLCAEVSDAVEKQDPGMAVERILVLWECWELCSYFEPRAIMKMQQVDTQFARLMEGQLKLLERSLQENRFSDSKILYQLLEDLEHQLRGPLHAHHEAMGSDASEALADLASWLQEIPVVPGLEDVPAAAPRDLLGRQQREIKECYRAQDYDRVVDLLSELPLQSDAGLRDQIWHDLQQLAGLEMNDMSSAVLAERLVQLSGISRVIRTSVFQQQEDLHALISQVEKAVARLVKRRHGDLLQYLQDHNFCEAAAVVSWHNELAGPLEAHLQSLPEAAATEEMKDAVICLQNGWLHEVQGSLSQLRDVTLEALQGRDFHRALEGLEALQSFKVHLGPTSLELDIDAVSQVALKTRQETSSLWGEALESLSLGDPDRVGAAISCAWAAAPLALKCDPALSKELQQLDQSIAEFAQKEQKMLEYHLRGRCYEEAGVSLRMLKRLGQLLEDQLQQHEKDLLGWMEPSEELKRLRQEEPWAGALRQHMDDLRRGALEDIFHKDFASAFEDLNKLHPLAALCECASNLASVRGELCAHVQAEAESNSVRIRQLLTTGNFPLVEEPLLKLRHLACSLISAVPSLSEVTSEVHRELCGCVEKEMATFRSKLLAHEARGAAASFKSLESISEFLRCGFAKYYAKLHKEICDKDLGALLDLRDKDVVQLCLQDFGNFLADVRDQALKRLRERDYEGVLASLADLRSFGRDFTTPQISEMEQQIVRAAAEAVQAARTRAGAHLREGKLEWLKVHLDDLQKLEMAFTSFRDVAVPAGAAVTEVQTLLRKQLELLLQKGRACLSDEKVDSLLLLGDLAKVLVDIHVILEHQPALERDFRPRVRDLLTHGQESPNGSDLISGLYQRLQQWKDASDEEKRIAELIPGKYEHFAANERARWAKETAHTQRDPAATVSEIVCHHGEKKVDVDRELLLGGLADFEKHYMSNVEGYKSGSRTLEAFIRSARERAAALPKEGGWSLSGALPELLADIFAYHSLRMLGKEGVHDGVLPRPHNIQVMAMLQLLRYLPQSSTRSSAGNQLMNIRTGEGKSMILGGLAVVLALLGKEVPVVCYSEALSSRDWAAFKETFEAFAVVDRVRYSTVQDYCESWADPAGGLRSHTADLVLGRALVPLSEQVKRQDEVLLVDEVDRFFSPEFYGRTHNEVVMIPMKEVQQLLLKIWGFKELVSRPTALYRKIQGSPEYSTLRAQFPLEDVRELVDMEVKAMCRDLKFFGDCARHPYHFDPERGVYYSCAHGVASEITMGYMTAFALLKELEVAGSTIDSERRQSLLEQFLQLRIPCGRFSYMKFPASAILGVSGTAEVLNKAQQEALKRMGLERLTLMPSVYGKSNFKLGSPFLTISQAPGPGEKPLDHHRDIAERVKEQLQKSRPVLVVFRNMKELASFKETRYFRQLSHAKPINILQEDASPEDQEYAIKRAASCRQVTLMTAAFGRGTDFVSDSQVSRNGGVHVLQTFVSQDEAEEVQIRGRTARQGKPGSFSMVLREDELEGLGGTQLVKELSDREHEPKEQERRLQAARAKREDGSWPQMDEALRFDELSREYQAALETGDSKEAAARLLKLRAAIQGPGLAEPQANRFVLLIDATGSMESVWTETRACIGTLLQRIKEVAGDSLELRIGAFKDYSDDPLFEWSEWSSDPSILRAFIDNIKCEPGSGGDVEEAVEYALLKAREEHTKTRIAGILLIGDAPPHSEGKGNMLKEHNCMLETDFKEEAGRLADLGVPVHAVWCGAAALDDAEQAQVASELRGSETSGVFRDIIFACYSLHHTHYHILTQESFKEIADTTGGTAQPLTSAEKLLDALGLTIVEEIGGPEMVAEYKGRFCRGK